MRPPRIAMFLPAGALALGLALPSTGCALMGGKNDKSVAQWQKDSKSSIREGTPQAEEKLRKTLIRDRERLEGVLGKHIAQAELSDDVILGTRGFNDSYEPDTFENQIRLLDKHNVVPVLDTPENRDRGKFYKPIDAQAKANLQKLYKKKQLIADLRVALANTEAVGMYLVAEQRDTLALNWATELYAMQYGAKIKGFEQQFATDVSAETLGEMAQVLAIRDQTRSLMITHTALLASFDGVASGGDPHAVTELAKASKKQLAEPPAVATDTARAYVSSLSDHTLDLGAALEASMRDAVGDEVYERHYQRELVRAMGAVEKAEAEASLYEQIDDSARKAKMQEFKQQARTVQERLTERATQLAGDKAKGFISALPFGSQALAGLRAVKELRNGNARGAIEAAIEAAPPGPIKAGMQTAASMGFAAASVSKRRRARG